MHQPKGALIDGRLRSGDSIFLRGLAGLPALGYLPVSRGGVVAAPVAKDFL